MTKEGRARPQPRPNATKLPLMTVGSWVLERFTGTRFPYRVRIFAHDGRELLKLRAQDRWPAANRNIFCMRDEASDDGAEFEEVERVPVLNLQRRGIRLCVVLDRKRYKRCDFLFLTKPYKNRPGSYEQIFWQTPDLDGPATSQGSRAVARQPRQIYRHSRQRRTLSMAVRRQRD